jgi:hypothetical protein
MSRKRYAPEQIIGKLRGAEVALAQAQTASQVCPPPGEVAAEWMICCAIPTGPRLFTEKLSIMNLGVTQDFLAGSKCSYRKNIKTIFFGME